VLLKLLLELLIREADARWRDDEECFFKFIKDVSKYSVLLDIAGQLLNELRLHLLFNAGKDKVEIENMASDSAYYVNTQEVPPPDSDYNGESMHYKQ